MDHRRVGSTDGESCISEVGDLCSTDLYNGVCRTTLNEHVSEAVVAFLEDGNFASAHRSIKCLNPCSQILREGTGESNQRVASSEVSSSHLELTQTLLRIAESVRGCESSSTNRNCVVPSNR